MGKVNTNAMPFFADGGGFELEPILIGSGMDS